MITKKINWLIVTGFILLLAACGPVANETHTETPTAIVAEESPPQLLTDGDQDILANASTLDESESVVVEEPFEEPAPVVPVVEEEIVVIEENIEFDANGIQVGFTANGYPYRGNPEADIVIEEFSDFQ